MFKARTGQYPSGPNIGTNGPTLKVGRLPASASRRSREAQKLNAAILRIDPDRQVAQRQRTDIGSVDHRRKPYFTGRDRYIANQRGTGDRDGLHLNGIADRMRDAERSRLSLAGQLIGKIFGHNQRHADVACVEMGLKSLPLNCQGNYWHHIIISEDILAVGVR
jgi:hypothetical protein